MPKIIILIISLCILWGYPSTSSPMGIRRIEMVPMKARNFEFTDGELLKYTDYAGGEKIREVNRVTRYYPDKKIIMLYMDANVPQHKYRIHAHYTNYSQQICVSLDNASIIFSKFNILNYILTNNLNYKGLVYYSLEINNEKKTALYIEKLIDNKEIRTVESRIKIKTDYPIWDMDSFALIGSRYLDLNGGGISYIIAPQIIKEPIPGSLVKLGKETIETKAGKFITIKYGFSIGDPFLATLAQAYTREIFIWIEDNSRSLLIKGQKPGETTVLEEISEWQN